VKPATAPKRNSGGVANTTVVAGSVADGSKADVMPDTVGIAAKLASAPKRDSTKVQAVEPAREEGPMKEVSAEKLSQALVLTVEVRVMSGESIVKEHFLLSERIRSVKHRILKARGFPLWQQMLSCQGEMVNDQSTLGELNLPQDAVFDLVLKSGPSPEDMEAFDDFARVALTAGSDGMKTLTHRDIKEVRALGKPPPTCEKVCVAAMHMLAGLAPQIHIKKDGGPKLPDWSGCKVMMENATGFVKQVLELPSCIDQGRVMEERVARCRHLIYSIEGDSESEKILHVRRCWLMCEQLIKFLFGAIKYYEMVAEFRERFGGATITELKSHQ